MIRRRDILAGIGAACAAPAAALSAESTLTAADVHIDGYPTVEAVRWMSRRIEEATGRRLKIRVYHSGQLGRESDTVDLARFGALDLTRVNFAALNNPFPLTQIFALPYIFNSVEHMRRAVDGAAGNAVRKAFERRGLIGLAIYDAGWRCFYNVRRPIVEPRDLHGLKLRVPPSDIFIALVRALGANPTPLPYGEVYSALQTHLIDGAENNWRSFHTSRQFEVARYWSQSGHSVSPEALLMSERTFAALSASEQQIVLDAATASVPYMRSLWDRMEAESRAFVTGAGVKVNDVDRDAFHRAARPVVDLYLKKSGLEQLYSAVQAVA
jgi:tripartite ATP-independent transporter DctP family solute receptor